MPAPLPYARSAKGLRLRVRLTPKASADRILGFMPDADGQVALKIAVTAAPENGKANAAMIKLLARALDLPARDFSLVQGATDRRKLVEIAGDPTYLERHVAGKLALWSAPA